MRKIKVADFFIGLNEPLVFISGPCVIEGEDEALYAAEFLTTLMNKYNIRFIYKSSYDKANRSSLHTFRGVGIDEGLRILEKVKKMWDIPILTDVHSPREAIMAADVCDVIQIPAFLCRQTDLLVAAAQTKAVINVKKGQFMAPWDMKNVVEKILNSGSDNILLTDRGTCFGYNNLVSDLRGIPIMQKLGFPVIFDATHSVQLPGGLGIKTGGQREFIPILAKAAIGAGCNAIFAESHPNPDNAPSDSANMIAFHELPSLLDDWIRIYDAVNSYAML